MVHMESGRTKKANLAVEDEGPNPMLEKRPNAVDQFRCENSGPSETLQRQSADQVKNVDNHNKFPRLDNELRKKKSLIKVTEIKANDLRDDFDMNCSACAQEAIYRDLKNKRLKPKCADIRGKSKNRKLHRDGSLRGPRRVRPHHHTPKKYNKNLTGINKTKRNGNRHCHCSHSKLSKSIQCSKSCIIRKSSKCCYTSQTIPFLEEQNTNPNQERPSPPASMSPYNSYGSLGQEPMVSDFISLFNN